jgi:hypothetical protein
MADFRTDTSAIKVEQSKPMSLADMLSISKQSYELSKIKELYPAMIAGEEARSKLAQTQAKVAEAVAPSQIQKSEMDAASQRSQAIASGYIGLMYDPMIVNATKNPSSVNKPELVKKLTAWGILQGKEAGISQEQTMELIKPYIEVAQNNPQGVQDFLKQRLIIGLSPSERVSALTPSGIGVNTGAGGYTANTNPFSGMQPGQAIPGTQYVQQVAPGPEEVSGIKGVRDAKGNFIPYGGTQQTVEQAPPKAPVSNAQTTVTPPKEKPELITGESKVLEAGGVPQLNSQQKVAFDNAVQEKRQYKEIATSVAESNKTIDTALKKLSASAASAPGRVLRSAGKWLQGNEDLDILTKSLADLAVRQTQLMGAGTDAAKEAVTKTQGNADLTEGGLRSILQRVSATNTAFQQYMKASSAYEKSRGINNANVNYEQFKKAWAENYDTNIFILQNIDKSNMSKSEKELEAQKLFKGMSKAQMEEFQKKAKNIYALENGNYK